MITLGDKGALVKNARLMKHVPAFIVGPPVETTGAGDAFNGGFAVALSEGRDLMTAVEFGCAVARHFGDPSWHRAIHAAARTRSTKPWGSGGSNGRRWRPRPAPPGVPPFSAHFWRAGIRPLLKTN